MMPATHVRLDELAAEGSLLLTREPEAAAQRFAEAHDLAIELGLQAEAMALSTLIARSWSLRGSLAHSIHFARRALREGPQAPNPHYTLARVCEKAAASSAQSGKHIRALFLLTLTASEYSAAAALHTEEERKQGLEEIADDVRRLAQEAFTRCWRSGEREP